MAQRLWIVLFLSAGAARAAEKPDAAGLAFFEKKIRPVLVEKCYACHSVEAKKDRGGLRLDTRLALHKGGENGPALVPGKPAQSLLLKAIRHSGDLKMPPKEQLSPEVVADFEKWIQLGAPDPRDSKAATQGIDYQEGRKHWAYQPVKPASPPSVKDAAWPRGDIDRFILTRIEAKGLSPAPDAGRLALLRRVTFDLTGLPPSLDDLAAFEKDTSPQALERAVDRLLKSPDFGPHWARFWLDGVRFNDALETIDHYRDWVVRAFNDDLPYDQFVVRQLAGDLLHGTEPRLADQNLIATQMLVLNRNEMDAVEGVIEVVGQQLLGVSINCAKCHDHKYDAYSQADYYALAGLFTSTNMVGKKRSAKDDVVALRATPGAEVVAIRDAAVADTNLLLKGDPRQRGAVVPRRFPLVLAGDEQKPLGQVTKQSGRLELARWIADARHPLTARVMVNRLWLRLLGRGIVDTPNDFGTQGDAPTHPELLDHLADRFVKSGWSMKTVIRDIVLSRTYQQGVKTSPDNRTADLENVLLARMNFKRLQYEQIHDALYAVADRLDTSIPAPAVGKKKGAIKKGKGSAADRTSRALFGGDGTTARTFDGASPELLVERREASVTGPQLLYFLNNPSVVELATVIAQRVEKLAGRDDNARIATAYRLLLARSPRPHEIEVGTTFLRKSSFARYCQALICTSEFIYLD